MSSPYKGSMLRCCQGILCVRESPSEYANQLTLITRHQSSVYQNLFDSTHTHTLISVLLAYHPPSIIFGCFLSSGTSGFIFLLILYHFEASIIPIQTPTNSTAAMKVPACFHEGVEFKTLDGLTLRGSLYPAASKSAAVIMSPGVSTRSPTVVLLIEAHGR